MKKQSIKKHLKPYSIYKERKTTINNAFASALAPNDTYNDKLIDEGLRLIGQNPDVELHCIYCNFKAETWDHLISLVKNSELRGYGHQIGNLVPCCKSCNSKKGAKDWESFIDKNVKEENTKEELKRRLKLYLQRHAKPVDLEKIKIEMPEEWAQYLKLREQIFELMNEADMIAEKIRSNLF
ncbi:MAG: HNH endonuclease [Acidobacteriota bacterium]